jgi:hypothetical protein
MRGIITFMNDIFLISRFLVFFSGLALIIVTLFAAIKTFIMPRGVNVWLTRFVFWLVGIFFRLRVRRASYDARDWIMAFYAPITLFLMPLVLLVLILTGYMALFWAVEPQPIFDVFRLSGSSLLTLGYASVDSFAFKLLEFSEAMVGLILIAILIAYLPTMYAAFAKRETAVALWEARAGSPPTVEEMITRTFRTGELDMLREVWMDWERWFAELEESHTSLAPLIYFRSPVSNRSWVLAAGNVMDSAAFLLTAVDVPFEPRAAFCIRAGFLSLRAIAKFHRLEFDPDPQPGFKVSVTKSEFMEVCAALAAKEVPLVDDLENAWQHFQGWRLNYDQVLLKLAALTMAPYAPWISDRSSVA